MSAPAARFDHDDFMVTQVQLVTLAGLLHRLPLAAFVAYCDRADALGPLLDPTLYQRKGADLARLLALGRAALDFCRALERLGLAGPTAVSEAELEAALRDLAGEER